MHAKFAAEAAHIFSIVQKGNSFAALVHAGFLTKAPGEVAVPHLPVVQVAILRAVVVIPPVRATGPVSRFPIEFLHDLREKLVVVERTRNRIVRLIPIGAVMDPLVFIVAAPQRHAGMDTQPAYLVTSLRFYLIYKAGSILRVHGAGEHKILPNQNAQTVAQLV